MSAAKIDERGVMVFCPACGQKLRIPFEQLAKTGQCGRCQAPIPPPGMPVEVNDAGSFDQLAARAPLPILVDFWAPWCGPCRMVAPEVEKVAATSAGKFLVTKVNTEELPALAQRFRVASIPTLAVFAGGREVGRTAGARPAAGILDFVRQTIGAGRQ